MRKIVLILVILFTSIISAQNKIDSLLQVLATEKVDTAKVRVYTHLGDLYNRSVPDTAIYYYKKGLQISETIDDKRYTAENLLKIGSSYEDKGDFKKAQTYLQKALNEYVKLKDQQGKANVFYAIAIVYKSQTDYDKAIEFYKKSLNINEKLGNEIHKAYNLEGIGILFFRKGQYDKAIEYFQKGLKIIENSGDISDLAPSYINYANVLLRQDHINEGIAYYHKAEKIAKKNNDLKTLGAIYLNLGVIYRWEPDWDKSTENYNKALKILTDFGDKRVLTNLYDNLGVNYEELGNNKKALDYAHKSLALAKEIGNKDKIITTTGNIAAYYNNIKQYKKAIIYAKKSIALAKENEILISQMNVYEHLSNSYKGLNDHKKALEYKVLEAEMKDSIFTIKKTEKIEEIQTKYETEKKELEIAKKAIEIDVLEKDAKMNKIYLIATGLILALALLSVYLFYRQQLMQSKHKADLFNQKLLRLQMNPHFIFNTLTSIQSYMFEKDTKKAAMYLSAFSKLTRSILDGSRKDFVSLQEDYDNNDNYLKIQQMRFDNLFDYAISVDESIDPDTIQIAPMLIQPFIENAVIHGFKDIKYQGHLKIAYKKVKDSIQITVEDNGKSNGIANKENHKSHALSITKERLRILNKKSQKDITFKISNSDKGYKVVFTVPLKVA